MNKQIIDGIKKENFRSFAFANLVLETFDASKNQPKPTVAFQIQRSNEKMTKKLEQRVEALEIKMKELTSLYHFQDSSAKLDQQKEMIDRLFETIDHKFLKLDYLDYKSKNLELEDIAFFIKSLDHEVMYFESLIQDRLSINEIVDHLP